MVPVTVGITICEPLTDFDPDQSFSLGVEEAVQDVALVLDQLSVSVAPADTEFAEADKEAVGTGGALGPPPQPCKSSIAAQVMTAKAKPSLGDFIV